MAELAIITQHLPPGGVHTRRADVEEEGDVGAGDIYERYVLIEQTTGSIYRRFAERFTAFPEASALWNHMAEEEARHASLLYGCQNLLADADAGSTTWAGCDDEARRAGLDAVRMVMQFSESPGLTLEQAVFLTVRLEALAVEKLLDTLMSLRENKVFKEVARQMVTEQKDHLRHVDTLLKLLPAMTGGEGP